MQCDGIEMCSEKCNATRKLKCSAKQHNATRRDAMQDRHRHKSGKGRKEEHNEPEEYDGKVTDAKDFAPVPKKVRGLCVCVCFFFPLIYIYLYVF